MFKKKQKLEFLTLIPEVQKTMPIIPAKELKHEWLRKMAIDFSEQRKKPDFGTFQYSHTSRCPGIVSLIRSGWILRAWQDVYIEKTSADSLFWRTPLNQKDMIGIDQIEIHKPEEFKNYFNNWSYSFNGVLKYQSPWSVIIPKGYYLLEIPVAYSDDPRFETATGYLSYEYGQVPLNPQFFWKTQENSMLIEKGTPIAQYILVKKEEVEISMRTRLPEERKLEQVILGSKFVKNMREYKQEVQNLYKR